MVYSDERYQSEFFRALRAVHSRTPRYGHRKKPDLERPVPLLQQETQWRFLVLHQKQGQKFGIDCAHLNRYNKYTRDVLAEAVVHSKTWAEVCQHFQISPDNSGTHSYLIERARQWGIDFPLLGQRMGGQRARRDQEGEKANQLLLGCERAENLDGTAQAIARRCRFKTGSV
jgi:hypothetical protein